MALANLILNAYESLKRVHDVIHLTVKTVKLSEIPVSLRFPVDWQQQGEEYACVEVLDTGCGIAEADMEKLFDPFFAIFWSWPGTFCCSWNCARAWRADHCGECAWQ